MNIRKAVAATTVIIGLAPVSLALGTSGELSASSAAPSVVDCDTDYPPSDYPLAPECTTTTPPAGDLQIEVLSPVCEHDVPYLTYSVSAPGSSASTATITFVNPTGANYVVSGVPLQGRILWPGAVVNAAGEAVDWPGWTVQADGTYTPGDEWNWARQPINVVIEVNPSATRSVSYPEATPACVAGPRTPGDPGDPQTLPATGSGATMPLVFAGLGAAMLGGALMFLARRRSTV